MKFKNILLLAGGISRRFWPLTDKTSVDFLGKSLITHQLEALLPLAEDLHVVTNKENYQNIFKFVKPEQITIQGEIPGQAGAILSVKNKLKGEVLILNSNDIFDLSILDKFERKYKLQFLAKKTKEYFPGGYVKFDRDKVIEIIEKPDPANVPSDIIRLVVDFYENIDDIINALSNLTGNPDDHYERGMSSLIKTSGAGYINYEGYWHTIKYPWHVLPMMHHFLNTLKSSQTEKDVVISDKAVIIPPVYLGKGVRVGDFAKIVGPVYIGEKTIIGDHTMVRQSQIGNNCLIGGYSEVTRSYLGDKVMLHRNYVGDSVLDEGVLMGADAITANFRFDQKNINSKVKGTKVDTNMDKLGVIVGKGSKIGVNTTILPGVKIGKNTFIGPGEVVREDVEDEMYVFGGKKNNKK